MGWGGGVCSFVRENDFFLRSSSIFEKHYDPGERYTSKAQAQSLFRSVRPAHCQPDSQEPWLSDEDLARISQPT